MIDQVMPAIHRGAAIKGFKRGALFGDACHPRPLGSNVSLSELISSVTPASEVWRNAVREAAGIPRQ
jgi:hypothetical protein